MDRPRRTTRQAVKTAKVSVVSDPAPRVVAKRKVDREQRLNSLLENSKSELTSMELPVCLFIINFRVLRYRHFENMSLFFYPPFTCDHDCDASTGAQ